MIIAVTAVNDPPTTGADESLAVAEGGTTTTLDGGASSVLANDSDPEGGSLFAAVDSPPTHGTLTLATDADDGTFSYTHDDSENLSDSFTYHVHDGSHDSLVTTVTITIAPVNDKSPVANPDAFSLSEGGTATQLVGGQTTVLHNDPDAAIRRFKQFHYE